jgi:hypothetical protein
MPVDVGAVAAQTGMGVGGVVGKHGNMFFVTIFFGPFVSSGFFGRCGAVAFPWGKATKVPETAAAQWFRIAERSGDS